MYSCPKWAPVNKEVDLLGSLKCLLKSGGRELFLGGGADGSSFSNVEASACIFLKCLLFVWVLTATLLSCSILEAVGIVAATCIPSLCSSNNSKAQCYCVILNKTFIVS